MRARVRVLAGRACPEVCGCPVQRITRPLRSAEFRPQSAFGGEVAEAGLLFVAVGERSWRRVRRRRGHGARRPTGARAKTEAPAGAARKTPVPPIRLLPADKHREVSRRFPATGNRQLEGNSRLRSEKGGGGTDSFGGLCVPGRLAPWFQVSESEPARFMSRGSVSGTTRERGSDCRSMRTPADT